MVTMPSLETAVFLTERRLAAHQSAARRQLSVRFHPTKLTLMKCRMLGGVFGYLGFCEVFVYTRIRKAASSHKER